MNPHVYALIVLLLFGIFAGNIFILGTMAATTDSTIGQSLLALLLLGNLGIYILAAKGAYHEG